MVGTKSWRDRVDTLYVFFKNTTAFHDAVSDHFGEVACESAEKRGIQHSLNLEQLMSHVLMLLAIAYLIHLLSLTYYYRIYFVYDI